MPPPDQQLSAPTLADIQDAASALSGISIRTPLMESADVNARLGGRLLIKAENAQRTGAFKIRGAYNRICQLNADAKKRGVIAYSSGNHGQAVALAAKLVGTTALIVMPSDASALKMDRIRGLGGEIITYDRATELGDDAARRIRDATNRIMVPPSEDRRVMAGAGTVPLELYDQAVALGATLDAVLVPCGGGGLTAVTAIVMAALSPTTQVYAAEPELFDDTCRSLKAGKRLANPSGRKTICDAIMTPTPGKNTFSINKTHLAGGLSVSDDQVCTAMKCAFDNYKSVVEPGAAVGLAAVLSEKIDIKGKTIAVIITGGNVDTTKYCSALHQAEYLIQKQET